MDTKELLAKVRKIEIKTKGLSKQLFAGEYQSAFKGRGMSFSEVRDYTYGDNIRDIDWNVSARFGKPFVKVFEEERELTMMLLVDVSASNSIGSNHELKKDLIAELSAILAFSALQNNDKVGVIFFSNKIEKYIPPKKGKSHILRIIREILAIEATASRTSIPTGLNYLMSIMKKKGIVFLISDFRDSDYAQSLKIASKRHDLIGVRILDKADEMLPRLGLIKMLDPEEGKYKWVNTFNKRIRKKYSDIHTQFSTYFYDTFVKSGTDKVEIRMDESYVKSLIKFFKMRG